MINSLVFKKLNNLEFSELTDNNVFLFDNIESLREFYPEFEKLMKNIESEDVLYSANKEVEIIKIEECVKCRGFTAIYRINYEQRFIFTLEPISILTMTSVDDLWFVDKKDNWSNFDFSKYENFEKYKTNEDIYRFVCESRYGIA